MPAKQAMPDLCRILDFVPLRWRYATAVALPLAVGWILYVFLGWWSIAVASLIAVIAVWFLGYRQMLFFLQTANGIIRTRSIDRRNRLEIEGPPEQQRIINAVNRLADSVEQTLSEANRNRRYQETILNEITVGILVVDANAILQYANPAACHTLGFDLPNRLSAPIPLASKVNIYEINEAVTISATDGETARRNIELYDSHRHLEVFSRPLPADDNGVNRAILIINDRTDEIRLGVAMREFIANASHELRTPIASIQASVDTLKLATELPPEVIDQFLDRIDDGAQRMTALVNELMDLTQLESGRSSVNLQMTNPADLIGAVMKSHGPVGIHSNHEISTIVADDLPDVLIDRPKMERAIGNLLVNAMKFTPPDGKIKLECKRDGKFVAYSIQDSGEGIDPEELPHIFERFYKSHRSSGDRTGFGLGLSITKNIVEIHNGTVEVQSVVGEGSTFTVRLPIP